MKFLCVTCDEPMKLVHTSPPDDGSITVLFRCPRCAQQTAMLTNPLETQMVRSLGVRIGPEASGQSSESAGKCPFSGMLSGTEEQAADGDGLGWTEEALVRLDSMPEFIRPMARSGIEKFARDKGYREVDGVVLDEARSLLGM
ncbi:MAG: PCP reductase family protein [Acidobacteriota bacterium]|nr:PCP reductase family protein [Acidobacteriota bacterium]